MTFYLDIGGLCLDFIKGVDVSMLHELEAHGAKYYDKGKQCDVFEIFKNYGINGVRLRIWNDPFDENKRPYGGGTNDLKTTVALAKRAVEKEMLFMLDIHYSDFWTDPSKQIKPKAWRDLTGKDLEDMVYRYTYGLITTLKNLKLMPGIVQVGNEITNGLLWSDGKKSENCEGMLRLIEAGISAVREVSKEIKIVLHLDNGGNHELYKEWFDTATDHGLDYDIIGLSYYPYWHGTLDDLEYNMNAISERYGKDIIIVETAYGFTTETLNENMMFSEELARNVPFPPTVEGQAEFMAELMKRIKAVKNGRGKGFFYWEPTWLPIKGVSWASEEGRKYLRDNSVGGNSWSNQALFDFDGNALPTMQVIKDFK